MALKMSQPHPFKSLSVVILSRLPKCNFCSEHARYDFKSKHGPWAFACEQHWQEHRAHETLGVGIGQKLVLESEV